jgi:hypothetical protein
MGDVLPRNPDLFPLLSILGEWDRGMRVDKETSMKVQVYTHPG